MKTRRDVWTILNTHAESGSHVLERDARESQMIHLSRSHEHEDGDQLCVIAGDLNLRSGEESALRREGWRDAWQSPQGATGWTWRRGVNSARYDRVLFHDACDGVSVECKYFARLTAVWPTFTDHVALHVILSATGQRACALAASATGIAARPSMSVGQASRKQRHSVCDLASQAPVLVVDIGNAIVHCA